MKNQKIICFGPSDFWYMNPSCATHLMRAFARENKVLYVNPFSSNFSLGQNSASRTMLTRIARKSASLLKFLRKAEPNMLVFSPVFMPLQNRPTFTAINNALLRSQLKGISRLTRMTDPILWVENVRAADLLEHFQPSRVVYHVSDLFSHCTYTRAPQQQMRRDKMILDKADVVICVSKKLYDHYACRHHNVHYLPHGVDFKSFRQAAEEPVTPELIAKVPRPIAGYFGTLTNNNDIELWQYCAEHMPDVSFVLAGQVTAGDYSTLAAMPNVYMPGTVPYQQIPQLCAAFDVCMLQWKMDPWIQHCNPLKMLEYMASGKPIVSVPIDEAKNNYSDIISIASTKQQWPRAIRWELENDNHGRRAKRIMTASKHSWSAHAGQISRIINNTINSGNTEKDSYPLVTEK